MRRLWWKKELLLLFLSLKDVKQSSRKSCFEAIKDLVDGLYSEYKEVRENLDLKKQKKFDKIGISFYKK